jgi:hypothetical protein
MQQMQRKEKSDRTTILGCLKRDGIGGPYVNLHRKRNILRRAFAVLVISAILAFLFGWMLFAQPMPPIPMPPPLTVKIAWDHIPAWEFYVAHDTNGVRIPITYRVYYATNVAGPWEVRATVTNNLAVVTNVHRVTGFFYVTSSNVFLESDKSDLLSLPMDPVKSPTFIAP